MTSVGAPLDDQHTGSGPWRSMAILAAAVVILSFLVLPVAYWQQGLPGIAWATGAAALCLLTGIGAITATFYFARHPIPIIGMLLAMAVRMLPPLAVCLGLSARGSGHDYFGFVCYLLLFYLATLAVETWLSVRMVRSLQFSGDNPETL